MRIIVQRVKSSSVIVKDEIIASIGQGLNLLVGISIADTEAELEWMVRKCLDLRLFPDQDNKKPWAQSIVDLQGEILVVSQFTLYGDCRKGRRPSFSDAAAPDVAESLYNLFVDKLKQSGLRIATGKFGAMMEVKLDNDGPVTLILERELASE